MASVTIGPARDPLNFTVIRGDTIGPIELAWSPVDDLSDRTWEAQVRGDLDEGTLVATFTVDASQAATGILMITLPASESRFMVTPHAAPGQQSKPGKGTYYWDLQATTTLDTEEVFTWIKGTISVLGDSTVSA